MKTIALLALWCPLLAQAQVDSVGKRLEKSVWRITFLAPGVLNEARLGPRSTLVSAIALGGPVRWTSNFDGTRSAGSFNYSLNGRVSIAYRYYYNLDRRKLSTRFNSGSYLSVRAAYVTPYFAQGGRDNFWSNQNNGVAVSLLWGVQQTFRKNLYLNVALGVGHVTWSDTPVVPMGNLTLGYTIPKH
jgi:hypothetical protein